MVVVDVVLVVEVLLELDVAGDPVDDGVDVDAPEHAARTMVVATTRILDARALTSRSLADARQGTSVGGTSVADGAGRSRDEGEVTRAFDGVATD